MINYYWRDGFVYSANGILLSAMSRALAIRNVNNINASAGSTIATLVIGLPPILNGE
jgi:hypothetical protein